MKYTESPLYNTELQTMSDFLELIIIVRVLLMVI